MENEMTNQEIGGLPSPQQQRARNKFFSELFERTSAIAVQRPYWYQNSTILPDLPVLMSQDEVNDLMEIE